jgi:type 1 glutamine amidotransferase
MTSRLILFFFFSTIISASCTPIKKSVVKPKLKALIIDGENSHGIWPKSTFMIKDYLEQTGLFEVDINRKLYTWVGPHVGEVEGVKEAKELLSKYPLNDGKDRVNGDESKYDPDFNPDFEKYDVVISNFGWKASNLPEATKINFEKYIAQGGGFISIHAANNAWGDWPEFNQIIGLGGWGGRTIKSGPYLYYNNVGEIIKDPSQGVCASHGPRTNFIIETREPEHPIMKGLPNKWLHNKDELYERLRGPAENITILATAYSDNTEDQERTGRHEPMLMVLNYGKGRIFHTTLGHMDYSMECSGFITTLQRGAEWAATGQVTQEIPEDFPNDQKTSIRKWKK